MSRAARPGTGSGTAQDSNCLQENGPEPDLNPRQGAVYGRLVGPRSDAIIEPDDWHRLLAACMRERRDELVETIRSAIGLLGTEQLRAALEEDPSPDTPRPDPPTAGRADLRTWAASVKERLDELVAGLDEPDPYQYGSWSVSYRVVPPADLSLPELRRVLMDSVGNETGWPAWRWPSTGDQRVPRPRDNGIECWMHGGKVFSDPAHADFWRASTAGQLSLIRGFDEDAAAQLSPQYSHIKPGTLLDPILAIWRVGECLLHAERFAARLDSSAVGVLVEWTGLEGRQIASLDRHRMWNSGTAAANSAEAHTVVDVAAIGAALPRIVLTLTEPLFVLFDFLEVPESVVTTELDRLRGRAPA
jgi:hypothetical protein